MKALHEAILAYEAGEHRKAFDVFRRLADFGEAVAMRYLGHMFRNGENCNSDILEAARWYLLAWKAKDEEAANAVVDILPQLQQKGHEGDSFAQFAVGLVLLYLRDDGVAGIEWLTKSAVQDHAEALQILADCLRQGTGVQSDAPRAFQCYAKAAELGSAKSMYQLGRYYSEGLGGQEPDLNLGLEWYRRASSQGFWPADMALCKILAKRNRDIGDIREVVQRLRAIVASDNRYEKCSISSEDGQWAVVVSDGGNTVGVSGVELQELGLDLTMPSTGARHEAFTNGNHNGRAR